MVSATFLVIANMVGTGIYTTTGFIVVDLPAGMAVLFLWALGGIAALGGAQAYAALAKRYPRSGGEYHFLGVLYHPFLGYLAGLVSLIAGFAAPIAASAYAFAAYLPLPLSEDVRKLLAAALILALVGVHWLGLARGARIQNLFVLVKLLLLSALVLGSLLHVPSKSHPLTYPAWTPHTFRSAAVALIFISFAYSGWNAAAYIMSEVPHAARVVPRAILTGTLIVMVLYVGFNYGLLRHLGLERLAGEVAVGRLLAAQLWGAAGEALFGWGVSLALVSSVSAMLMIAPRVLSVMGEDYPQLRTFSIRNAFGAPVWPLVLVAALAAGFLFSATFEAVMNYIGFTLSLSAGLTVAGLFWRHRQEKGLPWLLGMIFLLVTSWMVANNLLERPWESGAGLLTMAAVGSSYLWLRR